MHHLFKEPDLAGLDVRLSYHELPEQIELLATGRLDLAAIVIAADAKLVKNAVREHDLDIASPNGIEGLVRRHPWLGLGHVPAGLYDLTRPTPPVDKPVASVDTLVVANSCVGRAERVALLALLTAELPGFVRSNPPRSSGSSSALPLAAEARQFFVSGEPAIADRYFPWLVDLMSPAYWVYLLMAVTLLFNGMRGVSRFQLWRIDSAREKLEARLGELTGSGIAHKQLQADLPENVLTESISRTTAQDIVRQLMELRARSQRYARSIVTPMGDEMFYRYQEALIDDSVATLAALSQGSPTPGKQPAA